MEKARDVALYFLSKDTDQKIFDFKLRGMNGSTFYEGNARLNKYLHLSQNVYIAKYGEPLFPESLFAYNNGAVVPSVQRAYKRYRLEWNKLSIDLSENSTSFLDKMYTLLINATLDELIELSHEDNEWEEMNSDHLQQMNSMRRIDEYKNQYSDVVELLEMV